MLILFACLAEFNSEASGSYFHCGGILDYEVDLLASNRSIQIFCFITIPVLGACF